MQNKFTLRPLSRGLVALLAFTMVLTLGCGMAGGLVESMTGGVESMTPTPRVNA